MTLCFASFNASITITVPLVLPTHIIRMSTRCMCGMARQSLSECMCQDGVGRHRLDIPPRRRRVIPIHHITKEPPDQLGTYLGSL